MQLLLDFVPVLAFFIAYKVGGIYVATKTLMIAMVLLCLISWLRTRKVSNQTLVVTGVALVAGTLTLLFKDSRFIQWKFTFVEWALAIAYLLAPRFLQGETILQKMIGDQFTLTQPQWRSLNWAWIIFFVLMGALNLYVMYHVDEATWVKFKVFGSLGLSLIFIVSQGIWLVTHAKPVDDAVSKPSSEPHN